MLLQAADEALRLLPRVARGFDDSRRKASCAHSILHLLRQRVFALSFGYEDLNDHTSSHHEPVLQMSVGGDREMAGAATLCRFENSVDKKSLWPLRSILVDAFIESHRKVPEDVVLDFNAADDAVHGKQEGRFFEGNYDHSFFAAVCFLCKASACDVYSSQTVTGKTFFGDSCVAG